MEEQQIQDFVHRVSNDDALRQELAREPEKVVMREGFSPRVAQVVMKLEPHLSLDKPLSPSLYWWNT